MEHRFSGAVKFHSLIYHPEEGLGPTKDLRFPGAAKKVLYRFGAVGPAWNDAWDQAAEGIPRAPAKPVILPQGKHPFPSRTRKLSPAGPIVLHA